MPTRSFFGEDRKAQSGPWFYGTKTCQTLDSRFQIATQLSLNGLLSLLSPTEKDGGSVELAQVGNEGMVGLAMITKTRTIFYDVNVPVETIAWRVKVEVLQQEFDRKEGLHDLMLAYVNMLITQILKSSICHRFHTLKEAVCRILYGLVPYYCLLLEVESVLSSHQIGEVTSCLFQVSSPTVEKSSQLFYEARTRNQDS